MNETVCCRLPFAYRSRPQIREYWKLNESRRLLSDRTKRVITASLRKID
jgi:hypothetical protein